MCRTERFYLELSLAENRAVFCVALDFGCGSIIREKKILQSGSPYYRSVYFYLHVPEKRRSSGFCGGPSELVQIKFLELLSKRNPV
ncbi:MAG: hypothetical protein NVSMB52_07620 [Chloroflexota bacterium]